MSIIYILLAILLLAILIVIHETGHFFAARLLSIPVREFAVGFGPKMAGWKSRKHETAFAVRAIPLGGYCSFYGEDETAQIDRSDPRIFGNHPVWKRLIVILMGPMMNFLLAFVLATGYYWIGGIGTITGVDPYISEVTAAGPAYAAGLRAGDVITEINGTSMLDGTIDTLTNTISTWHEGNDPLHLQVERDGEILEMDVTPVWDAEAERMRIGIMISGRYRVAYTRTNLAGAAGASGELCWNASGAILRALKALVTTGEGFEQTSGPVGIISIVSTEVRTGGFQAFIELMITISMNLGIMNLLPIPGLDGSRLLFGLLEAIRRKPIKPEREAMVNLIGMGLLFAFMIFLTFRDVIHLFR